MRPTRAERRCFTLLDVVPQLVFTGTSLKGLWKLDGTGAQVPEEDPKGVDVHRVVVLP